MIEENIDFRKYRNSTHLASVDLDVLEGEGKPLIFTVVKVWYDNEAIVNGRTVEGFFCKFLGQKKHLQLNSINKKALSNLAKAYGYGELQSYNTGTCKDLVVELFVDRNVTFMKKTVNGIRIKSSLPKDFILKEIKELFEKNKENMDDERIENIERIIEQKEVASYHKLLKYLKK